MIVLWFSLSAFGALVMIGSICRWLRGRTLITRAFHLKRSTRSDEIDCGPRDWTAK